MVGALATTLRHRLYREAAVNMALMSVAVVVAYAALGTPTDATPRRN